MSRRDLPSPPSICSLPPHPVLPCQYIPMHLYDRVHFWVGHLQVKSAMVSQCSAMCWDLPVGCDSTCLTISMSAWLFWPSSTLASSGVLRVLSRIPTLQLPTYCGWHAIWSMQWRCNWLITCRDRCCLLSSEARGESDISNSLTIFDIWASSSWMDDCKWWTSTLARTSSSRACWSLKNLTVAWQNAGLAQSLSWTSAREWQSKSNSPRNEYSAISFQETEGRGGFNAAACVL